MPLWAPTAPHARGLDTAQRAQGSKLGTTVEGAGLQMRPHRTRVFFPENGETGTTVPHRAGSMELAIPWPQASITLECRTGGVISYCRTEAMLSAV